jgi:CO/xanthine dehydrogenase Mo-binding subunit
MTHPVGQRHNLADYLLLVNADTPNVEFILLSEEDHHGF